MYRPAGGRHLGAPYARLALAARRRRDSGFDPHPPYPRPRFADQDELRVVLEVGMRLFFLVMQAIDPEA